MKQTQFETIKIYLLEHLGRTPVLSRKSLDSDQSIFKTVVGENIYIVSISNELLAFLKTEKELLSEFKRLQLSEILKSNPNSTVVLSIIGVKIKPGNS